MLRLYIVYTHRDNKWRDVGKAKTRVVRTRVRDRQHSNLLDGVRTIFSVMGITTRQFERCMQGRIRWSLKRNINYLYCRKEGGAIQIALSLALAPCGYFERNSAVKRVFRNVTLMVSGER